MSGGTSRRPVILAAAIAGLAAAGCRPEPTGSVGPLTVSGVLVAAPVEGRAAMYFAVRNRSDEPDALIGVSLGAAARTELHRGGGGGRMAMMTRVSSLSVPARGELRLSPGADHVMLLDVTRTLEAGRRLTAELAFRRAGTVIVEAEVVPYADLPARLPPE
ncbi:MAG: copper chaperone PCu(A)C [Gemmatimonadota bacterium]